MRQSSWPPGFLILYLIAQLHWSATGQQAVFAYVLNPSGNSASESVVSGKYARAKRVYNTLLTARGDLRQAAPEFVMTNGEQRVAWMNPATVQIGLEEKAYDICMGFGPDSLNALSALLAHEMTHYFEKHDWNQHFARSNADLGFAKQIAGLDEGIKQETQADYLGGFLALTAGYDVYDIMPQLLPQIYRSYGLPEQLAGYPSLNERIQMSQNASAQLRDLQTVFETANYLSALEQYETASAYYRFVLQSFPSREIYNNAGVNDLMAALALYTLTEMPFVLPAETDPDSRLYSLKGLQADRLEKRKILLDAALDQFDRALQLDPDYALAYLNKACVFTIEGAWDDAAYWLQKFRKIRGADAGAAMVLEGIQAALQQDSLKAERVLNAAQQQGNALAGVNLRLLHREATGKSTFATAEGTDKIDGFLLDDFLAAPGVDKELTVSKTIICGAKQLAHSKILLHYADHGAHYTVLQICGKDCSDKTLKSVGKGSTLEDLRLQYGLPTHTVTIPNGQIMVYRPLNLLFEADAKGTVQQWACFRQSPD